MRRGNRYENLVNGNGTKNLFPEPKKIEKRNFIVDGNGAVVFSPVSTSPDLPAGEYMPSQNRDGQGVLIPIERRSRVEAGITIMEGAKYEYVIGGSEGENLEDLERALDGLPPLPDGNGDSKFVPVHRYFPMEKYSKGLNSAKENINRFLQSKEKYERLGMDYRRSILLYGDPGTGKSQFIYQLSRELIRERDAIVLRIENTSALSTFFESVLQPISYYSDRLKVVVIEELADMCSGRGNVTMLLNMLDSMQLRENVLFLITTNYPDRIPSNIVDRPARLDLLCSIYNRDLDAEFIDAWFEFCMGREITGEDKDSSWYKETRGNLSPAYLKELFIYSQLHEITLDKAWQVVKDRRREIERDFSTHMDGIGF
jgi:hypothetical protein